MKKIESFYMVTHRYDLPNLIVCLASIKYWHPDSKINIIVNQNNGDIDLGFLRKAYHVDFIRETDYRYGRFYGSLEPYIRGRDERFVILDTDVALSGPVLDKLNACDAEFIVDLERQDEEDTKRLYWDPSRVRDILPDYRDDWFTFNNGIVCGIGNKLTKDDFRSFMVWEDGREPDMKDGSILTTYDMSAINVVVNRLKDSGKATVERMPVMIYPPEYKGSESELINAVKEKRVLDYRIIHWADTKNMDIIKRPFGRLFQFYDEVFFQDYDFWQRFNIRAKLRYLRLEFQVKNWFRLKRKRITKALKKQ